MQALTLGVCIHCKQINRVPFDPPEGKAPICGNCKNALPIQSGVNELDTPSLNALIKNSPIPVVVDFWAPWCQPCLSFAPTFIETSRKLASKAVFAKCDTQAHPLSGSQYQVRSIPTLIVFKDGKEKARQSGAMSSVQLMNWLSSQA